MDPALAELVEGPPEDVLEVLLRLEDPSSLPDGVTSIARFGEVISARLARGDIQRVWADPRVVSLKAPRLLEYADSAEQLGTMPTMTAARRPADLKETGRGVVVGVLDWGFDIASPAFRRRDGRSRILALWDQRGLPEITAPKPYGYGVVHDQAAIDNALRQRDPEAVLRYRVADADAGSGTHGTHVADIAAGTPGPGREGGVAPDADLVFVHLAAGSLSGLAGLGDSVRILEGLDFIRRIAGGRPFVVNMSLGRHAGPQNGTTLVERAIDAILREAPGRAVVMSTGNYQLARAHAGGRIRPGGQQTLAWQIGDRARSASELEIWYPNADRLHAVLEGPGGTPRIEVALGQSQPILLDNQEVGRIYHRAFDPNSPDHHINVFLRSGAPSGTWSLRLLGLAVSDGRWDAFVERDGSCGTCQAIFDGPLIKSRGTLGSVCNGLLSVTVGAADVRHDPLRIAPFSSSGPTRDGRQKPDLVAPGVGILAARSRSPKAPAGGLTRKSGASQAAPHVAGTIALVFEAAQRPLSIHETRAAIIGTATLERSLLREPLRAGAGLLDPLAAINTARMLAPSIPFRIPTATEEINMTSSLLAYPSRTTYPWMGDSAFPENPAVIAGLATAGAAFGAVGDIVGALDRTIDFVQRRVITGAFSINAPDASVTPFPIGLGPRFTETRIFRLRCVQPILSDDILAFAVTIDADCFNIYNIAIMRHEAGSAFLINSALSLTFRPETQQNRGRTRPNVPFYIDGLWDPSGPGNEQFRGRLMVQADGAMELSIQAPGQRVRIEGPSRFGAARSCPLPTAADPGTPTPVPVTPPDGGRRSTWPSGGGGRSAPYPDSRHLLPTSPTQAHVFFLTSAMALAVNEMNRLQSWLNQLGTPVVEQIRNGGIPVFVTGHASRSGNEVRNMEISTQRARAAAEAVRGLLGPGTDIRFQGQGSRESVGQHSNDQADRRATIRIQLPG